MDRISGMRCCNYISLFLLFSVVTAISCTQLSETDADVDPGPAVDVVGDFGYESDGVGLDPLSGDDVELVRDDGPLGLDDGGGTDSTGPTDSGSGKDHGTVDPGHDTGVCVPVCESEERECGPDGCGQLCGYCLYGYECTLEGKCEVKCTPACAGKECGDDGCRGECEPGCSTGFKCGADFMCHPDECVPDCEGKDCGDNECGGSCGECAATYYCAEGGICTPNPCDGIDPEKNTCSEDKKTLLMCPNGNLIQLNCGNITDPISGDQYVCRWDPWAFKYQCMEPLPCEPQCDGKECGDDGCGGSCGTCPTGWGCPGFECRPVEGATCGWITNMGTCWDDGVLYQCTNDANPEVGKIIEEDCDASGKDCAYNPQNALFECR